MANLVTGFEPFGGASCNPSELVVSALAALGDPAVVTAVLPTSYRRAEAGIGDLLRAHRPRRALMLGLAGEAVRIRLEQVALNLNDAAAPDNDGEVRQGQRILAGAPVGYWSTLPLGRMAETARGLGEEVELSRDAGGYVCNHAFFTAAHLAATAFPGTRTGFVHLPRVERSDKRLEAFVDIVRAWIAEP
ncbi:MAG: pyroglutamyl-peptidase I [Kiloniellales bacterium]|nr:pyroglutamyl-peptidase I [Kiloniellales bacterium]